MSDIQQNRLWNFRQLVRTCGGVNEAARILSKKNSYITAIAGLTPVRAIGDKVAAQIEAGFGLAPGALDAPPPHQSRVNDQYLAQISSTLANASDDDKAFVLHMAQWLAARSIKATRDDTEAKNLVIRAEDV